MVNGCLLKTVHFAETAQWNVKHFFTTKITSQYSIEPIGKHTVHITEKTKLFDNPEKEYKILGISNEQGMFDAYTEFGKNINQPYIYVEDGGLAYNPYRINVGSIGLKTPQLKNDYISPAYVVFKCKETLLPEYLYLILKSTVFNTLIRENTTGSVRQTLSYDNLSAIKIPVPSVKKQQELLSEYHINLSIIEKLNNDIALLEKSIDTFLLDALGASVEKNYISTGKMIYKTQLSNIMRWDVWSQTNKYATSKYNFSKFASIVTEKPFYGANEKTLDKKTDVRYIRITDINEDGSLNDNAVSAKNVEEKYILENNDFLIARSGNTVGKTFLYKSELGKCIFAGYLIKFKLNTKRVIPEYVLYYTKSSLFKSWIQNNQRVFGQPNINGQEYLNADIIVPEIEKQKEIVEHIKGIRAKINETKTSMVTLTNCTKKAFEEAVFGEA